MTGRPHVVVVGGGIAGLAAALRLVDRARVTLLEGSDRLGGKLRTGDDGIETGAETFLLRDPSGGPSGALRLVDALGLRGLLVHPEPVGAALWVGGALRPIPAGTVMGIPGADAVLDQIATLDARDPDEGKPVLGPHEDRAVGELVRERLGDEVVDRLVDPLLGGVYAGRADQLSLAATIPALHRLLREEHTLGAATRRALESRSHRADLDTPADGLPPKAIFGTVSGGLSRLVSAAERRLRAEGAVIRTGAPVRALRRTGGGWEIDHGGARLAADALVLAVPAGKAARLLAGVAPAAAREIGVLDYASVGLVSLVLPPTELPDLSGFLVPETEGLTIKAATFFTRKWAHLRRPDGSAVLRCSVGRAGQPQALQHGDEALIRAALADLSTVLGGPLPEPAQARVDRWGGGLPQYGVGHTDRVAAVREMLAGLPVGLAGAGYDGVGIPVCVGSGERAADRVLEGWSS